mmetsp:Transcript_133779/g.286110  ORF Transcript_133779/g.286110 Transcript_133779/m.286110 type:complete len:202 (-) Transcript_133779:64-669(-)
MDTSGMPWGYLRLDALWGFASGLCVVRKPCPATAIVIKDGEAVEDLDLLSGGPLHTVIAGYPAVEGHFKYRGNKRGTSRGRGHAAVIVSFNATLDADGKANLYAICKGGTFYFPVKVCMVLCRQRVTGQTDTGETQLELIVESVLEERNLGDAAIAIGTVYSAVLRRDAAGSRSLFIEGLPWSEAPRELREEQGTSPRPPQ